MSYSLPSEVQQLVELGLATGQYANEHDLLVEALRLLHDRDTHFHDFKERLQARQRRLDRGEGIELEDEQALRRFFDDVQQRGKERYEATKDAE